jgi:hypothetical protein
LPASNALPANLRWRILLLLLGYGLSLEGASSADLVKSMKANSELVTRKGKSA